MKNDTVLNDYGKCPDCEKQLFNTEPDVVLTSNPPKKKLHCNNCSYEAYVNC